MCEQMNYILIDKVNLNNLEVSEFAYNLTYKYCYIDILKQDDRIINQVKFYIVNILNDINEYFINQGIYKLSYEQFELNKKNLYNYLQYELEVENDLNSILSCGLIQKCKNLNFKKALQDFNYNEISSDIYSEFLSFIKNFLIKDDIDINNKIDLSFIDSNIEDEMNSEMSHNTSLNDDYDSVDEMYLEFDLSENEEEDETANFNFKLINNNIDLFLKNKTYILSKNDLTSEVYNEIKNGHLCSGCMSLPLNGIKSKKTDWCIVSRNIALLETLNKIK